MAVRTIVDREDRALSRGRLVGRLTHGGLSIGAVSVASHFRSWPTAGSAVATPTTKANTLKRLPHIARYSGMKSNDPAHADTRSGTETSVP